MYSLWINSCLHTILTQHENFRRLNSSWLVRLTRCNAIYENEGILLKEVAMRRIDMFHPSSCLMIMLLNQPIARCNYKKTDCLILDFGLVLILIVNYPCFRYTDGVVGQHEKCGPAVRSLWPPHVPASVPSVSLPQGSTRLPAARKRRETE